jgi:hypothetical protein
MAAQRIVRAVHHQNRARSPCGKPAGRRCVTTFQATVRRRQRLAVDL